MNILSKFSRGAIKTICIAIYVVVVNFGFTPQERPNDAKVFLLNQKVLVDSKEKIKRGDSIYINALGELKSKADNCLSKGPYSVTYKKNIPPSGDKHDYMSVGPYWWPDSSKIDGMPYIRRDGQVNPERYTIKDAQYHGALCEDIFTLGLAWYFTNDAKYAAHATKLLKIWFLDPATKMNPNLNFGQAIPGIVNGRGIGIIDTHNLVKLIDGIQLLANSKSLTNSDYSQIQSWYKEFLNWMLTSTIGLDEADEFNNHGTWYDVQTVSMALFTEQSTLAKQILLEQSTKRIESQLNIDGSQPHELARTLSWNYSVMNLKGFFELAHLGENVGVDLWHYVSPSGKTLKTAYQWMIPFAEEKNEWTARQIKPIQYEGFIGLVRTVEDKYPDINFFKKNNDSKENSIILLTKRSF